MEPLQIKPLPTRTELEAMTCTYHEEWDENLDPAGPACGRPISRIVLWAFSHQWSTTCDIDHVIEDAAPPHSIVSIDEFLAS